VGFRIRVQEATSKEKVAVNNEHPLIGVCVACGNSIMQGDTEAIQIDGFWACGSDCLKQYREASAGWSEEKILRVKQWQEEAAKEAMQPPLRNRLSFWVLIVGNILIITATAVIAGLAGTLMGVTEGIAVTGGLVLLMFNVIYVIVWRRARRK